MGQPVGTIPVVLLSLYRMYDGEISMEELDSVPFPIPGLTDYRASVDAKLVIDCLNRSPACEDAIRGAVHRKYPRLEVELVMTPATREHRPLYPGKRHVLRR